MALVTSLDDIMDTKAPGRKCEAGFTLTELLVAMAMAIIVGMAGYVVFQTSNRSSVAQTSVSDAQQNGRVAMDRIAQDIRSAGFGMPNPPFSLTIASQTFTSPMALSNSASAPDGLTLLGGRFVGGTLAQGGNAACNGEKDVFICLNPADMANFFSGGVFNTNRRYVNVDGTQFYELATAGHVLATGQLQLNGATLARNWPDGTRVFIVEAFTYARDTVTAGCSAATPCLGLTDLTGLRGGGGIVADNIEDLQLAYGIDSSPRDGLIDDTNGDLTYTGADFVNTPAAPATASNVVAVRVNVVARTRTVDMGNATFARVCLEDRAADATCTGATVDGYRRRALTKVVSLRTPKTE
jgi:type IV pilus assembly protein PilW